MRTKSFKHPTHVELLNIPMKYIRQKYYLQKYNDYTVHKTLCLSVVIP